MSTRFGALGFIVPAGVVVLWAYGSTMREIVDRWNSDPQYSHGWLVPAFSAYLLYRRRNYVPQTGFEPSWWGLGIVAMAAVARFVSIFLYLTWLDAGSLLICLAGLFCTLGGKLAWKWSWPSVLFLAFMIPLPYRVQIAMGSNLQSIATLLSTYVLQTVGVPAISEGNVILLSKTRLGVVEACSGLSMLVTFFALATGFAILIGRHAICRVVMVIGAIPIAVLANVIRITITGVLFEANQSDMARIVFHDVAGWLMMPMGVGLLAGLLVILDRSVRFQHVDS